MAEKRKVVAAYPQTIDGKDVAPDQAVIVDEATALRLILAGLVREAKDDRQVAFAPAADEAVPVADLTKGGK